MSKGCAGSQFQVIVPCWVPDPGRGGGGGDKATGPHGTAVGQASGLTGHRTLAPTLGYDRPVGTTEEPVWGSLDLTEARDVRFTLSDIPDRSMLWNCWEQNLRTTPLAVESG